VTYDTPPDRLQAFRDGLVEVYLAQPLTDPDEISVGVRGFRESAIEIEMIGYLKVYANETQVEAQHRLILEIIRLAERLGVVFAAPTRPVRSLAGDEAAAAKKPEAAART
jgi:MscS family membrane protein